MKNDNLNILKQFARKLANCKYKVSVDSLIEYLNDGKFGYTFDDGEKRIVTNDFVFADDIATAVKHIRAIFSEPHISLKQENVIQNSAGATKTDARSMRDTLKDEKLWRVKGNTLKPEYVHAYVQEDNLAIYENRFVCYLIDVLFEAINQKIGEMLNSINTLNSQMKTAFNVNEQSPIFSVDEYLQYSADNNGLPVLLSTEDVFVKIVSSLIKSKKILTALKGDPVYLACKKAGYFDGAKAKNTNIFENDANYHFCYNFFMNYFNKDVALGTEEQSYFNFVQVNLFTAINNLGFKASENNEKVNVSNSANIKYEKLAFENNVFDIELKQDGDCVVVKIINNVDQNQSTNLLKVVHSKNPSPVFPEDLSNYTNVLTITDNDAEETNLITILPENGNAVETLQKLIKMLLFVAEGSEFIHTRHCPICGSSLISPEGSDYSCVACEGIYHIYNYEFKDIIWIKRMPRTKLPDRKAKADLAEIETTAVCEDVIEPETPVIEETITEDENPLANIEYVSKSFLEKLELSSKEINEYYEEIRDYILRLEKTRSKVSYSYDNFFVGRNSRAKLSFRGKTLVMYIALPTQEYLNTKYFPRDFSHVKKYEDTPMLVKVKSTRGVKFAKELIDVAFEGLAERKIVIKTEPIEEEIAQPQVVEENTSQEETAITSTSPFRKRTYTSLSFVGKMCQSSSEVKQYYNELKNYILRLNRTRANVSWSFDNFFVGRNSTAKLAFRGKTLVMYIALPVSEYLGTKYFPKDFGDVKKYESTPMMVKVKSPRGVKFAKELIDKAFIDLVEKIDFVPEIYRFPKKSTAQLIRENLAKKITME